MKQSSDRIPGESELFVVDRLENRIAVLIDEAGESIDVEVSMLPRACAREGAVLRVDIGSDSTPLWSSAVRDPVEEKRRLSLMQERLNKLKREDPGGDVSL